MDFETFKKGLQQKHDDAASFATNKEVWKQELEAEATVLANTLVSFLDELVAKALVKITRPQNAVFWPGRDDPDFLVLEGLKLEFDEKQYFLTPELRSRTLSGKPELRFYGSKFQGGGERHGSDLVFSDGQWYWTSSDQLAQPLNKDSLAKTLMSID